MIVIGLTGGIGAGKSTVARFLKELGAKVIDADVVARKVVEPGKPAWEEIRDIFGPQYLNPDGTINRRALGNLIFNDAQARAKLNAITHPQIKAEILKEIERYRGEEPKGVVVIEAPLLLEARMEDMVDEIWVVTAPEEVRLQRLMERDNLSQEEALKRIRAQLPEEIRVKYATRIINTRGNLEATRAAVRAAWEELRGRMEP
ncbi:dephospho-CoA kinase [Thermanaeromonas toyohensis ToBE]|uniref:Dephospho-CoA kinase n=1 Tax=Thermanaeromonas toyohensis ToBE TaxID=698762 RepID=A0A1W1W0E7_9FIRM|nr:dephospho-CoA kinase [Thermanaeromonas toyohensis]SMB99112.1 dephospho-CoA kinase [Thermanaeromonas toyohensis ToBE]